MMLKSLLILWLAIFFRYTSFSQSDISGNWEGIFLSETTDLGKPKLVVEIFNFKDSLFMGLTHLYYRGNKYEHYRMQGRYLKKDSLLVFIEVSTIAVDLGIYGNCLGTYVMKLVKEGNYLVLDGIWIANIPGCTDNVKVKLQKKIPEVVKLPLPKKNNPPLPKPAEKKKPSPSTDMVKKEKRVVVETTPPPVKRTDPVIKMKPVLPPVITQRETDVQSLLEIDAADKDSIRVDVYDNAEIDGDVVSVYEGEVQRINNKRITTNPVTFYVSLNKKTNPIVHLRLVAESLGSIPPCTALMIVTTKSKRHEVHLSSNFKSNATVELFLKE